MTLGAFDDSLRHSISKMSWYHFVANSLNKKRVIQLGEDPKRIFVTGSVGVDVLRNTRLHSKKIIEKKMNFKFNKKNLLITYHPVTLEKNTAAVVENTNVPPKAKTQRLMLTTKTPRRCPYFQCAHPGRFELRALR